MIKKLRTVFLFTWMLLMIAGCAASNGESDTAADGHSESDSDAEAEDSFTVNEEWAAMTNSPETEINAWGDSITEGAGGFGVSYPSVLAELTGMKVNNFGIGGEDSEQIMLRSLSYGRQAEDILIIQMGDNGGWDNPDELIRQYQRMIEESGSEKYIIITSSDDPDDFEQLWGYTHDNIGLEDTWYEEKFRRAFGEHLFISRKYLIENGLRINRLEMTEEDRARAEKGNISLQLRNPEIDNTHLNAAGYTALAQGLYEKGKELGYW